MKRDRFFIVTADCVAASFAAAIACIATQVTADEETPEEIIAAQIKRQGYACEQPRNATRDEDRSKPDEAVWVLKCESGTYRVKLVPDMAAEVERLE